jgi:hypothetical protein
LVVTPRLDYFDPLASDGVRLRPRQQIEAVEKRGVLPVRRSLVRQWTAFGMMKQRTLLKITVGCYFASDP